MRIAIATKDPYKWPQIIGTYGFIVMVVEDYKITQWTQHELFA